MKYGKKLQSIISGALIIAIIIFVLCLKKCVCVFIKQHTFLNEILALLGIFDNEKNSNNNNHHYNNIYNKHTNFRENFLAIVCRH